MNTGSTPAPFSLRFIRPDGSGWPLSVAGADPATEYSDTIPVGGSRILETGGSASALTQGWGQVVTSASIAGTAIFRQQLSADRDSEGTAPVYLTGTRRFFASF